MWRALTNEPTAAPGDHAAGWTGGLDAPQKPGLRPGDVLLVFAGDRPAGLLRVRSMKLTVVHAQVIGGEDFGRPTGGAGGALSIVQVAASEKEDAVEPSVQSRFPRGEPGPAVESYLGLDVGNSP